MIIYTEHERASNISSLTENMHQNLINCGLVMVTYIRVNIGWDNGLLPDGCKTLPVSMDVDMKSLASIQHNFTANESDILAKI